MPSLDLTSGSPAAGRRERFAAFVSLACLVHCVGLVVLAPLLPGVVALLAHHPVLEAIFWGSSVTLAALPAFGRSALGKRAWLPPVWMIAAGLGGAGMALELHVLLIVSLSILSLVQIAALVARARAHRLACAGMQACPNCCEHGHGDGDGHGHDHAA